MLAKLQVLEAEVEARGHIGNTLSSKLKDAGITSTPQLAPGNTSVYAQYTIQVNDRPAVQAAYKEHGIPIAVHYPTLLCLQPALAKQGACAQQCQQTCRYPVAQAASERVLSLPFHPYLNETDQLRIAAGVIYALPSSAQQTSSI